jgi:outer membrane cobalamin receptor
MQRLLHVLLFSVAFAPRLVAQQPGTLSGTITDPHGSPLGGAHVLATQIGVTQAFEADSGADGRFLISLPPGRYRILINRTSFARAERELELGAGESKALDVQMALEPLAASVVVTAEITPAELNSAPVPVTVVTRQEIDQRAATSLPDLLATLPGFSLARTGREGGLTTLFLDGGNSYHTKVLVDGTPINDSGGFMDYSDLTLDNVAKIEVVHGAESALYGSDALAGVVQVFTRRGTTARPELDLTGEGGSFSTGRGEADLSGLVGPFDYSASAGYFSTQGQGPNDFFVVRTFSGNFGWKFSDTDTLRLALRSTASDAGLAGQTLLVPPDLTRHYDRQDLSANLSWNAQSGPHWRWRLAANEATPRWQDSLASFPTSSQFNRAGLNAEGTYLARAASFTGGYAYEVENGFPSGIPGQHARRNNQAGYLAGRWTPLARLTFEAGARAEDNSSFGTRVVPRVGGAYLIHAGGGTWGDTRLRGFYGQGIVEPRLDQSFGNDPCFPGNPNLRPEESHTGSGGIEQSLAGNRLRVSVDYFYTELRDVISFAFLAPTMLCTTGTGTFFNTDLAFARGTRVTAEEHVGRWLTVAGNYIYDDTRVLKAPNAFDPTQLPGNRLFHRPLHSGGLTINAAVRRVNFNLNGYFTGRRTDSTFLPMGPTQAPGYARWDLAASYRLERHASLFLRAANLFDKQYQDVLGFPALGREVRGGLRLRLGGAQ